METRREFIGNVGAGTLAAGIGTWPKAEVAEALYPHLAEWGVWVAKTVDASIQSGIKRSIATAPAAYGEHLDVEGGRAYFDHFYVSFKIEPGDRDSRLIQDCYLLPAAQVLARNIDDMAEHAEEVFWRPAAEHGEKLLREHTVIHEGRTLVTAGYYRHNDGTHPLTFNMALAFRLKEQPTCRRDYLAKLDSIMFERHGGRWKVPS